VKKFANVYAVFLFGMGVGFLIAGFLLAAYPHKPSKMQIEEMARDLGMVYREEVVLYESKDTDNDGSEGKEKSVDKDAPVSKENEKQIPQLITIKIEPGLTLSEVGDLLVREGVIENKDSFVVLMQKMGLSNKLRTGTYTFKRGEDILKVITALTGGGKGGN